MNNLHKHLAPVSSAAWAEIEEEAARTIRRHLAAAGWLIRLSPKASLFRALARGAQQHSPRLMVAFMP